MSVWFIAGASRGFGAQLATEALRRGHQVVATARNPRAVTAALPPGGIPQADRHLLPLPLDVTDEAPANDAVQAV